VVEALLAKGADVEAKANVSIARAGALCPSRSLAHIVHGVVPKGDQDGASDARLERHSETIPLTHARAEWKCTCMYTSSAVYQGGASARWLERHSEYAPGSVRLWPAASHGPEYVAAASARFCNDPSPSHILADVTEARDAQPPW
jgi:hypothetical protein